MWPYIACAGVMVSKEIGPHDSISAMSKGMLRQKSGLVMQIRAPQLSSCRHLFNVACLSNDSKLIVQRIDGSCSYAELT